ncbi:MAG: uracil-DNA glycosylase family protein [Alkalispirochaeta sp.]
MSLAERIIHHHHRAIPQLNALSFSAPVTHVYNPLDYARQSWEQYLRTYGASRKEVIFLGMNPGPWGMAQTGIPFGEVQTVRSWLALSAPIGRPEREHPNRPVLGLQCSRSEVSGRRLWGLFAEEFGTAERFFQRHLVINYCPLVFMAETGRNITPDKLPVVERTPLFKICDGLLRATIDAYEPGIVVGVGAFARSRLAHVLNSGGSRPSPRIVQILHPSPASPAANRGWAAQARGRLIETGVWQDGSSRPGD